MTQEASFTFTTPLNLNVVQKSDGEHLFVEGDISTNDIDFVNDIMTKECQESMQKQILDRNMKLDLEHEAFKGDTNEEKEINKTKIPAGKIIDATVKDLGKGRFATRVKCEINRHNPNYKSIKGNLVEKYLDAFSVAFLPTDISYNQQEGKAIRMLNDVTLLNVAMTGNPCNTKAQMVEISTKSMDALEEYKKRKSLDPSVEGQLEVKSKSKIIKKENKILKLIYEELKYKYSKRTGSAGNYIYWYWNPKKLKLEPGKKPKEKKPAHNGNNDGGVPTTREGIVMTDTYRDDGVSKQKAIENLLEHGFSRNDAEKIADKVYGSGKKSKSHSTEKSEDITKLHTKNSKMTENENEEESSTEAEGESSEAESEGSESVEAKSVEMLKSISLELKSMKEAYEVVAKDNVSMKEELSKITAALKQPVHKSTNVNKKEEDDKKVEAEGKSVDPLDLC